MTGNMNRIEKDTRNEPITKTGTQIHTETDTETRIGTRIMIEKYGVKRAYTSVCGLKGESE